MKICSSGVSLPVAVRMRSRSKSGTPSCKSADGTTPPALVWQNKKQMPVSLTAKTLSHSSNSWTPKKAVAKKLYTSAVKRWSFLRLPSHWSRAWPSIPPGVCCEIADAAGGKEIHNDGPSFTEVPQQPKSRRYHPHRNRAPLPGLRRAAPPLLWHMGKIALCTTGTVHVDPIASKLATASREFETLWIKEYRKDWEL